MKQLKDFLILEESADVLDFRFTFQNILMWPFIRYFFLKVLTFKEYRLGAPFSSEKKYSVMKNMIYLMESFKSSPFTKKATDKYDILIFSTNLSNIKKGSEYFNTVNDYFALTYKKKTLILEDSIYRTYFSPRSFPNIFSHDAVKIKAFFQSLTLRQDKMDILTVKKLLKFVKSIFPQYINDEELKTAERILLTLSKRLKAYYHLYNRLFDRFDPKVLIFLAASYGGKSYITKWAKDRNIVVAEQQHGLISCNRF